MNKENAKDLLFELKDILEACNVEFFLNYGTCLSAYRGAFCDGDLDIDLGVKHEVIVPKMKILKETFTAHKFAMKIHSSPFIYERGMKVANRYRINVDIIDYAINKNDRFHNHYIYNHAAVHEASLFENLKTINFLGKDFLVPNPVEKFLESIYGEDWRIPVPVFTEYVHYVQDYWRTTSYYKVTEMFRERKKAAWKAYKIGTANLMEAIK